jgi:hypothetical protein
MESKQQGGEERRSELGAFGIDSTHLLLSSSPCCIPERAIPWAS